MHINIITEGPTDENSLHFFDYFYSYLQYLDVTQNYKFSFNSQDTVDFTILLSNCPVNRKDVPDYVALAKMYDLIMISNQVENTAVLHPCADSTVNIDNIHYLLGSFLHRQHRYAKKAHCMPQDSINCKFWFHDPLFYMSFQKKIRFNRSPGIFFISGENRTVRQYFAEKILPTAKTVYWNSKKIFKTEYYHAEDKPTEDFIDWCNNKYKTVDYEFNPLYDFISVGIDQQQKISQGYQFVAPYHNHSLIVYPESNFYNYELHLTEKTSKCILNANHFLFFSGCKSFEILRTHGIRSIAELTPDRMNDFDDYEDPFIRIDKIKQICNYVNDNPSIFSSNESINMLKDNYINYMNQTFMYEGFKSFKKWIDKTYHDKETKK